MNLRAIRPYLISLAVMVPGLGFAAKVPPPSNVLRSSLTNITATEFVEVAAYGHAVFRRIEDLSHTEPTPELLDLKVPADLLQTLKPGARQIVVWSSVGADPRVPRGKRRDPEGPKLIVTTGLDPALFDDTAENRKLLAWDPGSTPESQRAQLPYLLQLIDSPEPSVQRFAIAEIALRTALNENLDDKTIKRLRHYAMNASAPEGARALLIESAIQRPESLGRGAWEAVAETLLTQTPVVTDGHPQRGHLVRQAFELAATHKAHLSGKTVERWLLSDNAGVVEAALLTIRRVNPEREAITVREALARDDLPATTREFLEDHERRLKLMTHSDH